MCFCDYCWFLKTVMTLVSQCRRAEGTASLFFCAQPIFSASGASFHWAAGNSVHTLFPRITVELQETKCEDGRHECWHEFSGYPVDWGCHFLSSIYWDEIAILLPSLWSSVPVGSDKKMSRCPLHPCKRRFQFWCPTPPFLRPPLGHRHCAALWQAGMWEGLWGCWRLHLPA